MAHFWLKYSISLLKNEECSREVKVGKTTLKFLARGSRAMVVDGYIKFNSHEITVNDVCD